MNQILKYILPFFILLVTLSCANRFTSSELKNNFTTSEISDLEKLVVFFQKNICDNNTSDFKECFEEFLPKWTDEGLGFVSKRIEFAKQEKIYSKINKSTFNEIWDFCMTYQIRPTEREYLDVCSKNNGKYQKFLRDFAKSNRLVKNYYETVVETGNFDETNLTNPEIWNELAKMDLNNPNVQVLIAVHILTMNDQLQRNMN